MAAHTGTIAQHFRGTLARIRPYLAGLVLVGWAIPLVAIGSVLMVGHWVALPTPDRENPALRHAVDGLTQSDDSEVAEWTMVHVLYTKCRCSQKIFDYLFARQRPANTRERILLVGPPEEYADRAKAAGFSTEVITRETLKLRFQIESAPLLLVSDATGKIRYAGGYTGRKQGLDYRDIEILKTLQSGVEVDHLPLFGCGVSKELQAYLDPIGIKYSPVSDDETNDATNDVLSRDPPAGKAVFAPMQP